jgi:LL-diaminopimelate aminotransferase
MTGPSKLLARLPPYPFAELERQARVPRADGQRLLRFGIGDPDLPPPDSLREAVDRALRTPEGNRYSSSHGEARLRSAFAGWMRARFGVDVDPDREVMVLIGSKEGLALLPRAVLDPGDRVAVPDPGYPAYANAVRLARNRPVALPLRPEARWQPDWEELPDELRLLYLNYPNNPTGAVATLSELAPAVDLARDRGFLIAYDNAYSELTYGREPAPSILQVEAARAVAVEFHSLSKTLGAPGWRLGFAVGQAEAIGALTALKSHQDSGAAMPLQLAAAELLGQYGPRGWPEEVRRNFREYGERLHVLAEGLRALGWEVPPPEGTLYLWHRARRGNGDALATRLLERAGVLVTPGGAFGRRGRPYVRWSGTAPLPEIREALDRIGRSGLGARGRAPAPRVPPSGGTSG